MKCVCVRGHLRVHGLVLLQAHRVSEGFAADLARERPGADVRSADVDLQAVRSGKHLEGGRQRGQLVEHLEIDLQREVVHFLQ